MATPNNTAGNSKVKRKRNTAKKATQAVTLGQVTVKKKQSYGDSPGLWEFTLLVVYKNLYVLGITLLRRRLKYARKLRMAFLRLRGFVYTVFDKLFYWLNKRRGHLTQRLKMPFLRIGNKRKALAPSIQNKREQGKIPFAEYGEILLTVLRLIWTILFTVFNHVAPVFAAYYLVVVIQSQIGVPLGLQVEYKGEIIGYIHSESEFDQAAESLRDRFIGSNLGEIAIEIPKLTLVEMNPEEEELRTFTRVSDLTNSMLQASGDTINLGYGLYIDNEFYGAVKDRDMIPNELEEMRQFNKIGLPGEQVQFVKSIKYEEGLYPEASFVSQDAINNILYSYESVDEIYTVKSGDTPSGIAEKLGVPYALLKSYNPEIETKLLEGQELLTARARPFLSVKNLYINEYEEEFSYEVEEVPTATYARGYREISRKGKNGLRFVTAEISAIDGIEVARNILNTVVIEESVSERVVVGTNDARQRAPAATSSGSTERSEGFIWPTSGGVITVGVGGYPGHTGVDIPRPSGTPIYAAAAGTVVLVKQQVTNYGVHLMIDHGDGFVTLYAHCSAIYVSVGDKVEQGQTIAAVGRTGRSTGNHLHFEVRYNGRIMNPRNYIG